MSTLKSLFTVKKYNTFLDVFNIAVFSGFVKK